MAAKAKTKKTAKTSKKVNKGVDVAEVETVDNPAKTSSASFRNRW